MLFSFPTIVAGLVLLTNVAAQSNGDEGLCQLNCSSNAADLSGCGDNPDAACLCASTAYVTSMTQCIPDVCKSSPGTVEGILKAGCPSGFAKVAVDKSKDNAAMSVRTGAVAASAAGLMFLALLV